MATQAERRTTRYEVYGNVAYEPVWEGGSVAAPRRQQTPRPRPHVRPKERTLARPRVQVREAGRTSPFAVLGFVCVGVLAALLLMSCARLTVINDETVQLRSQLAQLQEEEVKLLTQYELAYDLRTIEAQVLEEGLMVKPNSNQMVVLDLSEADNVVVYNRAGGDGAVMDKVGGFFGDLLA